MFPQKMTTSVAKASKSESSTKHNDRKTKLQDASEDKKKKFYQQKGHTHIIQKFTHLNEDLIIKDERKMYDDIFEDAVQKYNAKQKRDDRKVGRGKALTRREKNLKIVLLSKALDFRKMKKSDRQKFLAGLKPQDEASKQLKAFLQATSSQTRKELRKELTQVKHAETLGEAYYLKQLHSKQSTTHREFIMQLGNAADFNQIDPNNSKRILKSYDRKDQTGIWQKSKHVLADYVKNFEKRNPYMKICNASIHMDEQSPHLHLQVISVADTSRTTARGKKRNGLTIKNSFNGALECEGYKRKAKDNRSQFEDWSGDEQKELARLMEKELGVTRKRSKTNKFKNVHEYKDYQRQAEQELDKVDSYKNKTKQQVKTYNSNRIVLQDQLARLNQNQDKLDTLQNYPKLVLAYKKQASDAQSKQKDAEMKRDKALQEKAGAEKLRDDANRQAQVANANLVNQLKQRQKDQEAREKLLEARERDVNAKVLGGTDSNGNRVEGLLTREARLTDREKKVKEKETKLQDVDAKIATKRKMLADYSSNLDKKKQQILTKKNSELHSDYKKLKVKYSKDFEQFKEKNQTGSKLVTYASYIYHRCAETFIKSIDPSTANTYKTDTYNTSKTRHSMAYDLARGCYQNNDALSGKTGLEACLELAKGRKKRIWQALKATGKTFAQLVNTGQVKSLVKDLDSVDENGLDDEAIKQASVDAMKQEQKRQEFLQKQKEDHLNKIRNLHFHVATKSKPRKNDFTDDNF